LPGTAASPQGNFAKRWGSKRLFGRGYLPVPSLFLELYGQLDPPLSSGEALFVLHLMSFKWTSEAPYPSYRTIARRMGISVKMARTHAQNLEGNGYLNRLANPGRTNRFDLKPLVEALASKARRASKAIVPQSSQKCGD